MPSRIPLLIRDCTHRRVGIAVVQRFAFLPPRAPRSAEDRRRLADAARSMREHTTLFSIFLSAVLCDPLRSYSWSGRLSRLVRTGCCERNFAVYLSRVEAWQRRDTHHPATTDCVPSCLRIRRARRAGWCASVKRILRCRPVKSRSPIRLTHSEARRPPEIFLLTVLMELS